MSPSHYRPSVSHQRCGVVCGYDDRYAAADEISGKRRQPIIFVLRAG
jgi:hypothetical protein